MYGLAQVEQRLAQIMPRGGLLVLWPEEIGQGRAAMRAVGLDGQEDEQRLDLVVRKGERMIVVGDPQRSKQGYRERRRIGHIRGSHYSLCPRRHSMRSRVELPES